MDFFAKMKLTPAAVGTNATFVTGSLLLEAREGEETVCSRRFDVEHRSWQKGGRWQQKFLVKDGQETVLSAQGQAGSDPYSKMGAAGRVKFTILTFLFTSCVENDGTLECPLIFDNSAPPETDSVLLQLCRGNAQLN